MTEVSIRARCSWNRRWYIAEAQMTASRLNRESNWQRMVSLISAGKVSSEQIDAILLEDMLVSPSVVSWKWSCLFLSKDEDGCDLIGDISDPLQSHSSCFDDLK